MLYTQSQNMVISSILMGLAIVLFGVVMLAKPNWFKTFSRAHLKAYGGLGKEAEPTWVRWHKRSAYFCIFVGMVMVIGGGVRAFGAGDPFDPRATPAEALSAFSMDCDGDQVVLVNEHTGPIWIRLSHPTVFGADQMTGEDVGREELPDGWVFREAVSDSHPVALRASEVIHLPFGERVRLPLFGLSSADCGDCRLQVQVALYEDPESPPAFVGWRACVIGH
jgi:hypothetical protein